ncbi:hypothetical protein ACFW7J_05975 [Streptomyces sp. NPDC059525]|uniref:hypothetical protein n=1 Tax=Streptomyces sp. NPDC059525 TaxID=3346857 RepID=UPI0036C183FB
MATGEHLSPLDRGLGAVVVLKWLKYGGKLLPRTFARPAGGARSRAPPTVFPPARES